MHISQKSKVVISFLLVFVYLFVYLRCILSINNFLQLSCNEEKFCSLWKNETLLNYLQN